MPETYGSVRQMPCPDCGHPVMPDRDQLCPNCGYPLMFLRKGGGEVDAKAVPRSPRPESDATGLRVIPQPVPQPRPDMGPPRGQQVQCRSCGYPNEQARVRCERCGFELRQARPHATRLAPPVVTPPVSRRGGGGSGWLIALIILAVIALVALGLTLLWFYLG